MHDRIIQLVKRIVELEQELENELEQKQSQFRYHFEQRKIRFEQDMVESQRALRTRLLPFIAKTQLRTLLSIPIIYGLALPLLLLDLIVTLYQWSCFSLWGVARVRRRDYWVMDREQLAYLNLIERLNCLYCSYANGMAAYLREIASRTEQYWCPIKHARRIHQPHARYWHFSDYGDAEGYHNRLEQFREELRK